MGMTLKELLTKGEGTLSAQEAKALAAQCRMDLDTLYTLLEERGIKIQEEETEPGLDVEGIMAEWRTLRTTTMIWASVPMRTRTRARRTRPI